LPERLLTIAAFAGSLRKDSYNKALLRAAVELAPPDMRIDPLDLSSLPLYNVDLDNDSPPGAVAALRDAIGRADGLLAVTPEHNFSMSAVTKTVIEWASRPADNSVLDGKPVAVMGASTGGFGTARAQVHFRDTAGESGFLAMLDPAIYVSRAQEKFDASGRLAHESTRKAVREFLEAFARWIKKMRA